MKKFEIKDLLDPEKLKKLDKELTEMKLAKTAENSVKIKKRIDNQDNQARVNQWKQSGNILDSWGVEPED